MDYYATPHQGSSDGTGTFDGKCPAGSYVKSMSIGQMGGNHITRMKWTCSDANNTSFVTDAQDVHYFQDGGQDSWNSPIPGPFNTVMQKNNDHAMYGIGFNDTKGVAYNFGDNNSPWTTDMCPAGQVFTGFSGSYGNVDGQNAWGMKGFSAYCGQLNDTNNATKPAKPRKQKKKKPAKPATPQPAAIGLQVQDTTVTHIPATFGPSTGWFLWDKQVGSKAAMAAPSATSSIVAPIIDSVMDTISIPFSNSLSGMDILMTCVAIVVAVMIGITIRKQMKTS